MKNIFLLFICLFSVFTYSQEESFETMSIETVEEIPVAKNCASSVKDCFNEKMMEHIKRNFQYPERAAENDIQGKEGNSEFCY
jgi:hypothetical protein